MIKLKYIFVIVLLLIIFYININYLENFIEINNVVPMNIYVIMDKNPYAIKNFNAAVVNTSREWKIIPLSLNNITDYTYTKNISKYNNFKNKMFKDIIALEILHKNGGIYIDQEIIVRDGSRFDIYINEIFHKAYDCCLLEFNNNNIAQEETYSIKSRIYIAPKKSLFLKKLHFLLKKQYAKNPNINLYKTEVDLIKYLFDSYYFTVFKRNEKGNIFYGISLSKSYKNILSGMYIEKYYRKPPIF